MPDETKPKTISLQPSWKQYFISYLLCFLAVPVFGLGLIALYFVRKKHLSVYYEASDTQISSIDSKYHRNIDLVNIEKVDIRQSWLQQKLNIGTLVLQTSAAEMELEGLENPGEIKTILTRAAEAEKKWQREKERTRPRQPEHDPGSLDKMNYLTGLWQQGLISDEDYDKERKHFE